MPHTTFNQQPPAALERQKNEKAKKDSEFIRAVAVAYNKMQLPNGIEGFKAWLEGEFSFYIWPSYLKGEMTTAVYNKHVSEFAMHVYLGVLLFHRILNEGALKNADILRPKMLLKHCQHDSAVQELVKQLVCECVQNRLSDKNLSTNTDAQKIVYTLQENANELTKETQADVLKRYRAQVELEFVIEEDAMQIRAKFPKTKMFSCAAAFRHQLELLQKLVEEELYKPYQVAVSALLDGFKNQGGDCDALLSLYIDILKNARALIIESAAPGSQNNPNNAKASYAESVDALMQSDILKRESTKAFFKSLLATVGALIAIATVITAGVLLTTAFPPVFLILMLFGGFALAGAASVPVGGPAGWLRSNQLALNSMEPSFKAVCFFARKIKEVGATPVPPTPSATPT